MKSKDIDYFAPPEMTEVGILMRIKGNYRRYFVACEIRDNGLDSVPEEWRQESLTEPFKALLGSRNPSYRGGEDLPDLEPGEVEIARVQMVTSVHGEVTSLRARRVGEHIALRLVDEWGTDFTLPETVIERPFTAAKLAWFLSECDPSPLESSCQLGVDSWFYPKLQAAAERWIRKPQ